MLRDAPQNFYLMGEKTMVRETNQVKALAAYREKQKRIAALLSRIQDKLAKHTEPIINWGHVGDLGHVEELLSQIDGFLN